MPEQNCEMCGTLHYINFDHRFFIEQGKPDIPQVLSFSKSGTNTTSSYAPASMKTLKGTVEQMFSTSALEYFLLSP